MSERLIKWKDEKGKHEGTNLGVVVKIGEVGQQDTHVVIYCDDGYIREVPIDKIEPV